MRDSRKKIKRKRKKQAVTDQYKREADCLQETLEQERSKRVEAEKRAILYKNMSIGAIGKGGIGSFKKGRKRLL